MSSKGLLVGRTGIGAETGILGHKDKESYMADNMVLDSNAEAAQNLDMEDRLVLKLRGRE